MSKAHKFFEYFNGWSNNFNPESSQGTPSFPFGRKKRTIGNLSASQIYQILQIIKTDKQALEDLLKFSGSNPKFSRELTEEEVKEGVDLLRAAWVISQ